MLYSLKWYFNEILIIVAKKMGVECAEYFSPQELVYCIKKSDEIYTTMIKFFKQYKEWYNYHLEIEQKKHECDSQKLINLSNAFYQTRKNLMEMAEKYSNEKENLFEEPFLSAENFNSIMECLEKINNELDEEV